MTLQNVYDISQEKQFESGNGKEIRYRFSYKFPKYKDLFSYLFIEDLTNYY